jgi:transposase InsO family protein
VSYFFLSLDRGAERDTFKYDGCAESFFKTLKTELDIFVGNHNFKEVQTGVFEYIEVYYNRRRRHSALGYAIPIRRLE